jgi:hypothetical protein
VIDLHRTWRARLVDHLIGHQDGGKGDVHSFRQSRETRPFGVLLQEFGLLVGSAIVLEERDAAIPVGQ